MTKISLQKKRCLVTGGSGFLGSYVVKALIKSGFLVTLLGRESSNFQNIILDSPNIKILRGNFKELKTFEDAVNGQDYVIHLLGATVPRTSMEDPIYDISENIFPTLHLLNATKKAGIKRIIFSSSGGAIYGTPVRVPLTEEHSTNPLNVYAITKLAIEKLLLVWNRNYGMSNIILRISNIYGLGQPSVGGFGAVAVFIDKVLSGKNIEIWGDGSIVRDYINVEDVASAFIASLEFDGNKNTERVFNIGSGVGYSLNELINKIEFISHTKTKILYKDGNPIDSSVNTLDISLAKRALNFSPKISLDDGLKNIINFHKSQITSNLQN